jgi:hypothetical protein
MKHTHSQSKAVALPDPAPAIRARFWRVMLVVTLMAAFAAVAGAQTIKDGGDFFSADAEAQAQQTLAEWSKQHQKNVVVETFRSLPGDVAGKYETADAATKKRLVGEFTAQRQVSERAAVYLMINRSPGLVRVRTDKAIGQGEAQKLAGDVLAAMQRKDFDGGLAVFAADLSQMKVNANAAASDGGDMLPPSAFPGASAQNQSQGRSADGQGSDAGAAPSLGCGGFSGIFGIVILVVIVMLVIRVIRGFSNRNRYNGPPGYGQQNQPGPGQPGYDPNYQQNYPQQGGYNRGGGFGTGVAGGLMGGLLGGWLGSKVFGQGHDTSGQTGGDASAGGYAAGQDPNYSEFQGGDAGGEFDSGGDFGGDGGGDFGGGGDAGGDF